MQCLTPQCLLVQGVGAKPTLTERAKGLTATAIDTTTHLLDQAKIHVTGHGAPSASHLNASDTVIQNIVSAMSNMRT